MTSFLAFIGLVAILGVIAAAIFFFGGYYNVAATAADPEVVKWALSHVRDASIERHAQDTPHCRSTILRSYERGRAPFPNAAA